jgi:hypothetical protein
MLAGESNTAVWISPAREGSNYGFVVLLNRNGALVEETIFLYDDEFGNLDPSNDILNKVNQICSGDQVPVNYDSAEQFIENPFFVNSSGQEDLKNHVMELLGISSSNVQMSKQFDNELLSQGRRFLDEYAALVMEMSRLGEGSLHSEYYLDLYRQAELNRDALVGLGRRIKNSFQGYFADMSFMIDQDGHTKDSLTHLIESDDLYGLAYLGRSSQFEHGSSCAFGGGGAFGGIGYPGGEFNSNVRQGLVFGMTPISAIRFATESKKVKQLSLADWRKIMSYCKDKRLSAECGSCPYCKTRGYYKVSDNKLVCSNISCRRCA